MIPGEDLNIGSFRLDMHVHSVCSHHSLVPIGSIVKYGGTVSLHMGDSSPIQGSVIRSQLLMVEMVYNIRIRNIDNVVSWILATSHNDHEAYGMTAAINTWVATCGISGDMEIPRKIFDEISQMIEKQREFLH